MQPTSTHTTLGEPRGMRSRAAHGTPGNWVPARGSSRQRRRWAPRREQWGRCRCRPPSLGQPGGRRPGGEGSLRPLPARRGSGTSRRRADTRVSRFPGARGEGGRRADADTCYTEPFAVSHCAFRKLLEARPSAQTPNPRHPCLPSSIRPVTPDLARYVHGAHAPSRSSRQRRSSAHARSAPRTGRVWRAARKPLRTLPSTLSVCTSPGHAQRARSHARAGFWACGLGSHPPPRQLPGVGAL